MVREREDRRREGERAFRIEAGWGSVLGERRKEQRRTGLLSTRGTCEEEEEE